MNEQYLVLVRLEAIETGGASDELWLVCICLWLGMRSRGGCKHGCHDVIVT